MPRKSGVYKKKGKDGKMRYFQDGLFISKETYNALKNPRRRKRASDWVLPAVSVEGSKGKWFLEVYAPQGGRTSQAKRSRRVFLANNDNQSYIKMGKVYKTKAEAQKQRQYLLDQTELYLSMYSSYPDIYSLSQTKKINPRKRKNANHKQSKPMFKQVEHLLKQPKRNIERKTLIDLGYSRYWSITYKNGAFQHIPVTKTGKPVQRKRMTKTGKRKNPSYTFISDASHGWLKVPKSKLKQLGIADKISRFSYQSGQHAYLEQDRDARLFMKAMQDAGMTVDVRHMDDGNVSEIRGMQSYTKPQKSQKKMVPFKALKKKKNPKSGVYKKKGSHGRMMYFQDGKFISKETYDSLKNPRKNGTKKGQVRKTARRAYMKNSAKGDYILKLSPAQVEVLFDYHGGQTSMFYSVASQATMRKSGGQAKIRRQDMESFQIELNRAIARAGRLFGSTGDLRSLQAIDKKVEKLLEKKNPRKRKNASKPLKGRRN